MIITRQFKYLIYQGISVLCLYAFSHQLIAEELTQKYRVRVGITSNINEVQPIKWNPGHYVLTPFRMTNKNFQKMLDEIAPVAGIRGIQKRYTWASLEPAKDQYDFSEIKRDLKILRSLNKRLIVQIQYKSFHKEDNYAPEYLQGEKYSGGVFKLSKGGHNLVLWNDAVLYRLKKLYIKLGKELDSVGNLEAIVLPETSPGRKGDMGPGYDEEKYIKNLLESVIILKKAFPGTVVIQYANYPRRHLGQMTTVFVANGIGLGGPDTFPSADAYFLHHGVYPYYSHLTGVIPLAIAVQSDNYTSRKPHGLLDTTPVGEIYVFARDELRVNYLFWFWRKYPIDYFSRVLKMMAEPDFPSDKSGGLRSECPTMLGYCQ